MSRPPWESPPTRSPSPIVLHNSLTEQSMEHSDLTAYPLMLKMGLNYPRAQGED